MENDSENSFQSDEPAIYHTLQYTRDALILQSILDYIVVKGTEKNFTRDEITTKHLFSKRDNNKKLSSHYNVFNKKFVGIKKKLKSIQRKTT